jgi:hypothetical protein
MLGSAIRSSELDKSRQLFIRVRNETPSVFPVCVSEDWRSLESTAANACVLIAKAASNAPYLIHAKFVR